MSCRHHCIFISLIFFFLSLHCDGIETSLNFVPQPCIDIPIEFQSIESIKCLQLVPKDQQYGRSRNYTVQNYIVEKLSSCSNIVLFEQPDKNLFNICHEVCVNEYSLLFNNLSNMSIYNIFYSSTSNYIINNMATKKGLSYDYLPFDNCKAEKRMDKILLNVVYGLCGLIGLLTIFVIIKYIIACMIDRRPDAQPFNIRWLFDFFCCRLRKHEMPKTSHISDSKSVGDMNTGNNITEIIMYPASNNLELSSQSYAISSQGTENTQTSDQRVAQSISENATSSMNGVTDSNYFGLTSTTYTVESSVSSDQPTLQRLASKASSAISTVSNTIENAMLETKLSNRSNYYERF